MIETKNKMAKLILILVTCLAISSCSTGTSINNDLSISDSRTNTSRQEHLKNIQDSTTWDYEMLETDKQMIGLGDFGPFELGAFPVPDYNILGADSFKGLGNRNGEFRIENKKLVMNSFFVKENELNKSRLNGKEDEIFFQIIVLTDTIDNENYALSRSVVISRNHPDYLGQGFFETKKNRIDYLAFHTAGNDAYAIVNTRLFDLNFGRTILIAPQKDQTLRSLQVQSPPLTSDSVIEETTELLKQEHVIEFFGKETNI